MKKIPKMKIGKRASNRNFKLIDIDIEIKPVCKYLVTLLTTNFHIKRKLILFNCDSENSEV